jgi:hypothetical protein
MHINTNDGRGMITPQYNPSKRKEEKNEKKKKILEFLKFFTQNQKSH